MKDRIIAVFQLIIYISVTLEQSKSLTLTKEICIFKKVN